MTKSPAYFNLIQH